jgi:ParB family chromosome partitioning protein
MFMITSTPTIQRRCVAELRAHPRQNELVGDLSDHELDELVVSIRRDGQRDPIHILPDGTVVAGHQRVRAARLLGLDEVHVIVRNDLAEAGEREILRFLVEDNLHRRQMRPLELARAYRALKIIARSGGRSGLTAADRRELRDQLAARLGAGVSGRTLDRYERLLDAPREVQDAVVAGQLTMGAALKVVTLPVAQRQLVAGEITAGTPAREAVQRYCGEPALPSLAPYRAYRDMLLHLERVLDVLEESDHTVAGTALDPDQCNTLLERAQTVIAELLKREVEAEVVSINCDD